MKTLIFIIICIIISLIVIDRAGSSPVQSYNAPVSPKTAPISDLDVEVASLSIEDKIKQYADKYGVDEKVALRIADCESKTGKYLYNWQGSSAKGIYMFTDRTWKNYCKGDVLNEDDNIECFVKLYKSHPSWWKCQ